MLSNKHHDSKDDTIANEGTSHDEMSSTLTEMITSAEAERSDSPKEHLYPRSHREDLSEDAVSESDDLP